VVAHDDVLAQHAEAHVVLGGRDRGGAGAREDDLDLGGVFLDEEQCVEQGGPGNDGRAVLVIVEDGMPSVSRSRCSM